MMPGSSATANGGAGDAQLSTQSLLPLEQTALPQGLPMGNRSVADMPAVFAWQAWQQRMPVMVADTIELGWTACRALMTALTLHDQASLSPEPHRFIGKVAHVCTMQ